MRSPTTGRGGRFLAPRGATGIKIETAPITTAPGASLTTTDHPVKPTGVPASVHSLPRTTPSVLVTKIVTNTSDILSEQEIRNLVSATSRSRSRRLTLLNCRQLNRLYTAKGFTTARAVLPAQSRA